VAWKIIEPGHWKATVALEESQVSIAKDGQLTFRESLLRSVGISDLAVLLSDPDTLRLAIRRPKEHEIARAVRVCVVRGVKSRDTGRRTVRATRGFHALCLDPKACVGRMELAIKDQTILLNLAHIEMGKGDAVE
jgi:hypothetical protein